MRLTVSRILSILMPRHWAMDVGFQGTAEGAYMRGIESFVMVSEHLASLLSLAPSQLQLERWQRSIRHWTS